MDDKIDCLICRSELQYNDTTSTYKCVYCGNDAESNVQCVNGHFVCDSCHALSALDLIEAYCNNSTSMDPFEMADILMANPSVHMHGPEHHFLVPAVLLTAYYNAIGQSELTPDKLKEARKRSGRVPGGFCGSHGSCGAAIGTGIFISLILDSTPLAKEEWGMSNAMTGRSLAILGTLGGPRCCKRTTYLSLREATNFLYDNLNEDLGQLGKKICTHSSSNRECITTACPFYPRP